MTVLELGHAVLYVRDLERSRHFYGDLLGWPEVGVLAPGGRPVGVAFSGGRTHHELLLLEVGPDAAGLPAGRRVGLYHLGLCVGEDDDDLRALRDRLDHAGVSITGTADHGVTHSLYIEDPDGNELELYVDVLTPDVWRRRPELVLQPPSPLTL